MLVCLFPNSAQKGLSFHPTSTRPSIFAVCSLTTDNSILSKQSSLSWPFVYGGNLVSNTIVQLRTYIASMSVVTNESLKKHGWSGKCTFSFCNTNKNMCVCIYIFMWRFICVRVLMTVHESKFQFVVGYSYFNSDSHLSKSKIPPSLSL